MYKIQNEQIPQFQQVASSKGVIIEKRGKGREMSTVYVCAIKPEEKKDTEKHLNALKNFVREETTIFRQNNESSSKSAA